MSIDFIGDFFLGIKKNIILRKIVWGSNNNCSLFSPNIFDKGHNYFYIKSEH